MNWTNGMQRVLDCIENRLDNAIGLAELAGLAETTEYHLQRAFSMLTGLTLNEYIRMRRLTRAAADLKAGMKVIDAAVKYGYDSPDSFARAFARFHGLPPSEARLPSARLNACSPLHIKLTLEGGNMIDYRIEHKDKMLLLGYHRRFEGAPFGMARSQQEEALFVSTRAHQWMLRGIANDTCDTDVVAVTDVGSDGYTFWYGCNPDAWTLQHLYDPSVTGIDFMERFGFETLTIPEGDYAVFRTSRSRHPVDDYMRLREQISVEWLPGSGYTLRNAPELAVYHWYCAEEKAKRFIEIRIPIEK